MRESTPLLLVGAGPFGLSMAAYLKHKNVEHLHVGSSMDYWKNNMPKKMYLRSACDWHLDPFNENTILQYLETKQLKQADVEPLALDFYLGYTDWFQEQQKISPLEVWINRLDHEENHFNVFFNDGKTIQAEKVILAVGLRYFKNFPEPYSSMFPIERSHHTAEFVDFKSLKDKRVLIIGGRQSAFEWAGLIHEEGAKNIHLSYRHATPVFVPSDWTWVNPLLDAMVDNPGWFRNLSQEEKDTVAKRMWAEGRLKLEPWLSKRIIKESIHLHPQTTVTGCEELPTKELQITLSDNTSLLIDHIILATGYKVETAHLPLIANGNMANELKTKNGFPELDVSFQTSIPNLYITGFPAAQDFGPFFGFTAAARSSAKIIGHALTGG